MTEKKYFQLTISVSRFEFARFSELQKKGLSAREILEYSSCPCDKCKGTSVIANDKENGEEILIPKGILSKRK